MLRSLVLILVIVNAAFYAWSHGWLNKVVGVQPDAQHEPQRLALQVQADKIVVAAPIAPRPGNTKKTTAAKQDDTGATATAAEASASATDSVATGTAVTASSASAPKAIDKVAEKALVAASSTPSAAASTPLAQTNAAKKSEGGICIEAGPFNASEYASVEATLKPLLPAGAWTSHAVAIQGLWLVYMGPYPDPDMLQRKQAELRHIKGLNFEEVRTPANLAQGISLGRYTKLEEAEAGLNVLRNRGIRTARVVNVRPSMEVQIVRVAHANVSAQTKLAGLKLPQGKGFTACRP